MAQEFRSNAFACAQREYSYQRAVHSARQRANSHPYLGVVRPPIPHMLTAPSTSAEAGVSSVEKAGSYPHLLWMDNVVKEWESWESVGNPWRVIGLARAICAGCDSIEPDRGRDL